MTRRFFAIGAIAWLAACAPTTPAAPGTPTHSAAGAGHYASVHGLRMYYEIHGQGPPVLLLHGGMSSIPVWPEGIELFSKTHRVIAPEQMGHGLTADDPRRPMDYHAMAEDTVELLHQLGVEHTFVVGWSDGGILGMDLAMNHPGLVTKLAVSGADYHPSIDPKADENGPPTASDIPAFIREPYERRSPDGAAHWPILFRRVRKMWSLQPNFTPELLGKITAPTLVALGDHDFVSPRYMLGMARAIPHSALFVAADSTHALPKKRAAWFHETVLAFFEGTSPAASPPATRATPDRSADVRGSKVRYARKGHGAMLVLLGADDAQLAHFAERHEVIAPEPLGRERAEDVASLLGELQIEHTDVIGFGEDGMAGILVAASHPTLVTKLVVAGALVAAADLPRLKSITAKTLVVSGDRDAARTERAIALFEAIPGAQLWVAPNSEASLVTQQPALFDRQVDAFLDAAPAGP